MPAVDAFERALELGMGWGMVPDLLLAAHTSRPALVEMLPDRPVDVTLYWQHWSDAAFAALSLRNRAIGVKPWLGVTTNVKIGLQKPGAKGAKVAQKTRRQESLPP